MLYCYAQYPNAAIVSRPKLNRLGNHLGVRLLDGSVIHCVIDRGVIRESLEDFAAGLPVAVVKEISPHQNAEVLQRADLAMYRRQPYHLTRHNCETFATALAGLPPQSPQLRSWLFLGALVAAVSLAGA